MPQSCIIDNQKPVIFFRGFFFLFFLLNIFCIVYISVVAVVCKNKKHYRNLALRERDREREEKKEN